MSQFDHNAKLEEQFLTRRQMLTRMGNGFAGMSLMGLLAEEMAGAQAKPSKVVHAVESLNPLAPKKPHFPGKAKRVVFLFCNGGPSHVDTFDNKPMLTKNNGKLLPESVASMRKTERPTGACFGSPFKFQKYGQSGIEVSELFHNVASQHIDDMAVINSMHAEQPNHEPSLLLMNCGDGRLVRPSVGSWVTYGLGSENQNLPGYIAMCPGGLPIQEGQNWQSGFLPGVYQGTYIDPRHTDIEKLIENIRNNYSTQPEQRKQLDLLQSLNKQHAEAHQKDAQLEARIQSFELAYRMQMEATDAFDINKEPQKVREAYGEGVYARQLLMARRLLERGVRFVQLYHGAGQPWDNHDDIGVNHANLAREQDKPIAAFLADLKRLGLFKDTLVIWGGEFGRTPTVELPTAGANAGKVNGRDHNHYGFSMWMAGGGVKGGQVYGATDEFGFKAEVNPIMAHDLHATMLHLLGFDHRKLTYRYAGRDFRLTDVDGKGDVVKALLA